MALHLMCFLALLSVADFVTAVDPCSPNPCQNRGYCSPDKDGTSYLCHCINGYGGANCEEARECLARLDLAFVVDASTSICNGSTSCGSWDFARQLIHKLVDSFVIGPDDTNVALMTFATSTTVNWNLDAYADKSTLLNAVDGIPYTTGKTNTTGALKTLVSQIFTTAAGDRPDISNTAIMITDGNPNVEVSGLPAAVAAVQDSGIRILVVGVTNAVKEDVLKNISSPPREVNHPEHYFKY